MPSHESVPEIVMFVRHGEKPGHGSPPHGVNHHGEPDEHSLSVRGWTRAGALAGLFAHAPAKSHPHIVQPGRIFATKSTHEAKSKREKFTTTPVAERLRVDVVDSYAHGDEKDLAKEVLGQPESTLIVCEPTEEGREAREATAEPRRDHALGVSIVVGQHRVRDDSRTSGQRTRRVARAGQARLGELFGGAHHDRCRWWTPGGHSRP